MGYSGESGPSRSALAALKQFGLIEGRDQELRVTDLALKILQPMNEREREDGIREAFSRPELYGDILKSFSDQIPTDPVLISYLVRQKGFTPSAGEFFVRIFRDSQALVRRLADQDINISLSPVSEPEDSPNDRARTHEPVSDSSRPSHSGEAEVITFRLNPECVASVHLSGTVTQSAINRLIAFLELARDSYPSGGAS